MVRLAEDRRTEALQSLEKVNQYNLALIAFAGSFLSLLVSLPFERTTIIVVGLFLLSTIFLSLWNIRPQTVKGGVLVIDEDVKAMRDKKKIIYADYLLDIADLTSRASIQIQKVMLLKKRGTIYSACFLAIGLFLTYILHVYATPR